MPGFGTYIDEKKGPWKNALSGTEALALIEPEHCRLALVDAKFPHVNGLQLAMQILKNGPDIRIILVSGYFYKDDVAIQRALEQGLICGFNRNPFYHDELLKAVRTPSSS